MVRNKVAEARWLKSQLVDIQFKEPQPWICDFFHQHSGPFPRNASIVKSDLSFNLDLNITRSKAII
jgi:hypothetical protein